MNYYDESLTFTHFLLDQDANPKGTIPMKAGYSLIMNGQLDPENRGYHFFLKTPGRTYHFIAENDHERKAWFQAIHSACNKASGGKISENVTSVVFPPQFFFFFWANYRQPLLVGKVYVWYLLLKVKWLEAYSRFR